MDLRRRVQHQIGDRRHRTGSGPGEADRVTIGEMHVHRLAGAVIHHRADAVEQIVDIELGVGYGLTSGTDRLIAKAIIGITR